MRSSQERHGNSWLYLKIYTGYRTSDQLLTDILYPLWENLKEKALATKWFFIRYSDPEHHLRFRVKLDQRTSGGDIEFMIRESLNEYVEGGLVWKTERSVYVPEYDRYDKRAMAQAEDIFCADSSAVLRFLSLEKHLDENARWLFAIASIDSFLSDFNYSDEKRKSLLLGLNRGFGKEFRKDKNLAGQLSQRYRKHRNLIMKMLAVENPYNEILLARSVDIEQPISKINKLLTAMKISIHKDDLVKSIIHMSLNRIFRANNRLHEMVIYDLLFRAYKEQYHRSSNIQTPNSKQIQNSNDSTS